DLEPQNFDFEVVIHNTDLLTDVLLPELEKFIPGTISGSYNSQNLNLELEIEFPQIVYQTTTVEALRFIVDSDRDQLNYALSVAHVLDSSYHIKNMSLTGEVQNNLINTRLNFLDDEGEPRYLLGGVMESINDVFRFSFEPEQVILNYEPWNVPQNNFIEFGPEGITANDVTFERTGQIFSVNSRPNLDLEVNFQNFNLSVLSKMIERDENLLTGALSGNVVIDNQQEAFAFTSDLDIQNFSFKEDTLGNISIQASNPIANQYDVNLQISGSGNQVNVNGNYIIAEEEGAPGALDFNVNIQNLDLATVEAYAAGQLEDLNGALRGQMTIGGNTDSPQVRGELRFEEASFNLTMLNNYFKLANERIVFDEQGISFPNFRLVDVNNNPAVITGTITTQDYTDFQLGLDIRSRNFRVINTTEAEDDGLYFGTLILDSNIALQGNTDLPVIEGDINVKDGTNMTLIIPAGEAGIAEMEGIVEFVDMSLDDPFADADTLKVRSEFSGINLNMVIRTEREARFGVLMDPSGTDALAIRGEADLNLGINPSGDMTLTGRYEIAEGSYQLAFMGVLNRKFEINPGSSIIWNGDVMDATVDIRAIYNVKTSPMNLLEGRTGTEIPTQARQQFPFLVYLNMEGELMNPLISFGLDMPEDQRGVVGGSIFPIIQELNQEQQVAELNKQVFALLVLNSFLAQDPLAGGAGGGGVEGAARRSVSNLLTQQLNRLADRYISGFDLNIGVESYDDFSDTGEGAGRTELQVGISRQFLDNRLSVQVGGNIDVEGERARQQKGVSDIAGNVAVEYNITEDGRYKVRGFREQTFESVIDGQLIETGLGVIFTRDYNRLQELFRRTRRERELDADINDMETSREENQAPVDDN
ncbi:MAG: translocation/assembly module TamB, partial [Bacteroidota bacterium]|nr:translocation/assembly module TamB [Bacteroidota bacterium]